MPSLSENLCFSIFGHASLKLVGSGQARATAFVTIGSASAFNSVAGILIYIFRYEVGRAFVSDEAVIEVRFDMNMHAFVMFTGLGIASRESVSSVCTSVACNRLLCKQMSYGLSCSFKCKLFGASAKIFNIIFR